LPAPREAIVGEAHIGPTKTSSSSVTPSPTRT
jgi:hypothetical protein